MIYSNYLLPLLLEGLIRIPAKFAYFSLIKDANNAGFVKKPGREFSVHNMIQESTMKKIALSFVTLAALSSAALAFERSDDDRVRAPAVGTTYSSSESAGFTAAGDANSKAGISAYERLQLQSQENENGGN